jgi:hypothetical protein
MKLHYLPYFFGIVFTVLSCREEIIPPDNFVENINEPVQLFEPNSYTFLLNAKSFSMNLDVPVSFNSSRTRFNLTLIDYASGYADISVHDNNQRERFQYFIAEDVAFHSDVLDGYSPTVIIIKIENFSGKIKLEFRKTL